MLDSFSCYDLDFAKSFMNTDCTTNETLSRPFYIIFHFTLSFLEKYISAGSQFFLGGGWEEMGVGDGITPCYSNWKKPNP